jgi:hypothetical protein
MVPRWTQGERPGKPRCLGRAGRDCPRWAMSVEPAASRRGRKVVRGHGSDPRVVAAGPLPSRLGRGRRTVRRRRVRHHDASQRSADDGGPTRGRAVGATFALIVHPVPSLLAVSVVLGGGYGWLWWVLGGLTLMPLRLGMGLFVFNADAWRSLAGHLAYGLVLGAVFHLVRPAATPRHASAHRAAGLPAGGRWSG